MLEELLELDELEPVLEELLELDELEPALEELSELDELDPALDELLELDDVAPPVPPAPEVLDSVGDVGPPVQAARPTAIAAGTLVSCNRKERLSERVAFRRGSGVVCPGVACGSWFVVTVSLLQLTSSFYAPLARGSKAPPRW